MCGDDLVTRTTFFLLVAFSMKQILLNLRRFIYFFLSIAAILIFPFSVCNLFHFTKYILGFAFLLCA